MGSEDPGEEGSGVAAPKADSKDPVRAVAGPWEGTAARGYRPEGHGTIAAAR